MTRVFRRKNQCTLLQKPAISPPAFNYAAIMLYGTPFQETSFQHSGCAPAQNPHLLQVALQDSDCPIPLSLAANNGITIVFFSTGY